MENFEGLVCRSVDISILVICYCVLFSIFPSAMHHRRAASDTSMFKRMGAADVKKDSSSNHSSRSATPLVTSSLLRLGGKYTLCDNWIDILAYIILGSCELLSSSVNSRVQPPIQVQTSPKPPQQQVSCGRWGNILWFLIVIAVDAVISSRQSEPSGAVSLPASFLLLLQLPC